MKVNKLNLLWLVPVVLVVLFGAVALFGYTTARADGGTCIVKIGDFCLKDVVAELQDIIGTVEVPEPEALGALSSPDLMSNYIGVGGLRLHRFGSNLSASSTACSFAPDFGTTSVRTLTFQIAEATSTSLVLTIAKATNDTNATSTALYGPATIESGIKVTIIAHASTTDETGIDGTWTLGPDDVLNFDVQGLQSTPEDFAPGLKLNEWRLGTCGGELFIH